MKITIKTLKSFAFFLMLISAVVPTKNIFATSAVEGMEVSSLDHGDLNPEEVSMADPFEYLNRAIFQLNLLLDGLFIKPAAYAFTDLLSDDVQEGVTNFFDNLNSPVVLANDILQAEGGRAGDTLLRFLVNSTLGIGGIFDVAAKGFDVTGHKEDFGQTLGVWGVGDGPYLMLPLFGPSNLRDTLGKIVDSIIDPFNMYFHNHHPEGLPYIRAAGDGVVRRAHVLDLTEQVEKKDDPYAEYRILYKQNRDYHIKNGHVDRESPVPEEDISDGAPAA